MTSRKAGVSPVATWAAAVLLAFEVLARSTTRPGVLLDLGVPGYRTAFEHRRRLAGDLKLSAGRPFLVVLGDSTAERGVDACTLAEARGRAPASLAVPSGATREASQLLSELGDTSQAEVLYAVNPLNAASYSEWIAPTFDDLVRRQTFAGAAFGEACALFGQREAVLRVLERIVAPAGVQRNFRNQIGLTGSCGREPLPGAPVRAPDARKRLAQLRDYGVNWAALFREQVEPGRIELLAADLRGMRRVSEARVVLTPLRADFRDFLEREYPGLLASRREIWRRVVERAGTRGYYCASAVLDQTLFDDPVHLHELGRREFTTCLARSLSGEKGCCEPLAPDGTMRAPSTARF